MSERVEFQFRSSQPGWKSVPYPRTGGRETPVAKTVTRNVNKGSSLKTKDHKLVQFRLSTLKIKE